MNRRIILVRHGETRPNAEHRYVADGDPALSSAGEQQAAAVGEALSRLVTSSGAVIQAMYASPARRTQQTAKIVAEYLSASRMWTGGTENKGNTLRVAADLRLRELGFGTLEGLDAEEIREAGLTETFHAWRQGVPVRYPGGAETFEAAAVRARAFLSEMLEAEMPTHGAQEGASGIMGGTGGMHAAGSMEATDNATVVVVSHSHILRILMATAVLHIPAEAHRRLKLDTGRMAIIEWEGQTMRLSGVNVSEVGC